MVAMAVTRCGSDVMLSRDRSCRHGDADNALLACWLRLVVVEEQKGMELGPRESRLGAGKGGSAMCNHSPLSPEHV